MVETPHPKFKLRFVTSVSIADQKEETPPIHSWNWGFQVSVPCWSKRWRRCSLPSWNHTPSKVQTEVYDISVNCWSKGGDTAYPNLELRFWKSVSLADLNVETPSCSGSSPSRWRHLIQSSNWGLWCHCQLLIKGWTHPHSNLQLRYGSQCHLLIKRQRQHQSKVGT